MTPSTATLHRTKQLKATVSPQKVFHTVPLLKQHLISELLCRLLALFVSVFVSLCLIRALPDGEWGWQRGGAGENTLVPWTWQGNAFPFSKQQLTKETTSSGLDRYANQPIVEDQLSYSQNHIENLDFKSNLNLKMYRIISRLLIKPKEICDIDSFVQKVRCKGIQSFFNFIQNCDAVDIFCNEQVICNNRCKIENV